MTDAQNQATWKVYAVKYAEADGLPPAKVEVGADPHLSTHDLTYYVWLIRGPTEDIVVDSGFNAASDAKRGHRLLRSPVDGLRALGVDPEAVRTLIVTHLHYDHFGNAAAFPNATLHIQDREAAFATGRYMRHAFFRDLYEVDDVTGFVRDLFDGRVEFHDGDATIASGVRVHLSSGHTPGVQRQGLDAVGLAGARVRRLPLHFSTRARTDLSRRFRSGRVDRELCSIARADIQRPSGHLGPRFGCHARLSRGD